MDEKKEVVQIANFCRFRKQLNNGWFLMSAGLLTSRGYVPHEVGTGFLLDPTRSTTSWKVGDVYWRHRTAAPLQDPYWQKPATRGDWCHTSNCEIQLIILHIATKPLSWSCIWVAQCNGDWSWQSNLRTWQTEFHWLERTTILQKMRHCGENNVGVNPCHCLLYPYNIKRTSGVYCILNS